MIESEGAAEVLSTKRTYVKITMILWRVDKMIGSICGQLDGRGGGDGELIMNAQRIQQNAS